MASCIRAARWVVLLPGAAQASMASSSGSKFFGINSRAEKQEALS